MQHKAVLCAGNDDVRTAARVFVVVLQGAGFATNFAGCSLLTLFFEEVRRSLLMADQSKRQSGVVQLRSGVRWVLLIFSALIMTAALLLALGSTLGSSSDKAPHSSHHLPHSS